jgi:hypothetical protein
MSEVVSLSQHEHELSDLVLETSLMCMVQTLDVPTKSIAMHISSSRHRVAHSVTSPIPGNVIFGAEVPPEGSQHPELLKMVNSIANAFSASESDEALDGGRVLDAPPSTERLAQHDALCGACVFWISE